MNVVTMVGRLVKDVELRFTQSGKPVGNFTLAVNRDFVREGDAKADFFPIIVWGRQAEALSSVSKDGCRCAATMARTAGNAMSPRS